MLKTRRTNDMCCQHCLDPEASKSPFLSAKSIQESCPHLHFECFLPGGHSYTLPLGHEQSSIYRQSPRLAAKLFSVLTQYQHNNGVTYGFYSPSQLDLLSTPLRLPTDISPRSALRRLGVVIKFRLLEHSGGPMKEMRAYGPLYRILLKWLAQST